jgi:hypothetical protein
MMADDADIRRGEKIPDAIASAAPEKPASGNPEQNTNHRYEGNGFEQDPDNGPRHHTTSRFTAHRLKLKAVSCTF